MKVDKFPKLHGKMMTEILEKQYACVLPNGRRRYDYQIDVGSRLLEGQNVVLHAPTGAGKTLTALVPFIVGKTSGRFSRLIYTLPLRTLVRSIYSEAKRVVEKLGLSVSVMMQTGE